MKRIVVDFVPSDQMRYDTLDDYWFDGVDGTLQFRIADTGDNRFNTAILIHAIAEEAIAAEQLVTHDQIDDWDLAHPDSDEPGEEPGCPYGPAHFHAMGLEQQFIAALQVPWSHYENMLEATCTRKSSDERSPQPVSPTTET